MSWIYWIEYISLPYSGKRYTPTICEILAEEESAFPISSKLAVNLAKTLIRPFRLIANSSKSHQDIIMGKFFAQNVNPKIEST